MLVQLTLENVLSFDAPATFSMVAGKITKQHVNHVTKACGLKILRGAIVYGANAAGKSNLVRAVALFREMLLRNDCSVCAGRQFRLNDPVKPAMRFVFDYTGGERLFHYEVATNGTKVLRETLSVREDGGEDVVLFDRTPESSGLGARLTAVEWYANRTLKASALYLPKLIDDGLREHRKSVACSDLLISAYDSVKAVLPANSFLLRPYGGVPAWMTGTDFKAFLLRLLSTADVGITGLKWEAIPRKDAEELYDAHWDLAWRMAVDPKSSVCLREGTSFFSLRRNSAGVIVGEELRTVHAGKMFRLEDESEGTIRLVELAPLFYSLDHSEGTYFIDEFDCHLHPFLAKHLLRTFLELPETKAQLVVTAHDTNLLTQELWRTDEVWFAEKRPKGSTDLYSVYQFAPRFDKDLEKGYLQGMYGAIPYFGKEPGRG